MSANFPAAEPLLVQIRSDCICPFRHLARERAGWRDREHVVDEADLVHNPHPDVVPNSLRALEPTEWARSPGDGSHTRLHDALMGVDWVEHSCSTAVFW